MAVDLSFYGRAENAEQVKNLMTKHGYKLTDKEIGKGVGGKNQFESEEQMANALALAEYSNFASQMKTLNNEDVSILSFFFFLSFFFSKIFLLFLVEQRIG